MNLELLLRGLAVGYVVAAPVGPVNLLCIHRTLYFGRFNGFMTGIGGAIADGLFAIIAAFGLTSISNFLFAHDVWLRAIGGLFLLILGLRTYFTEPKDRALKSDQGDLPHAMAGAFLLTITNPVTILGFAAVFASIGLASQGKDLAAASVATLGVFTGSCLWWFTLSRLVGLLRAKLAERGLRLINRISGVAIACFGIATLGTLFFKL